jgi:putative ABC transport system substrate-binding protein
VRLSGPCCPVPCLPRHLLPLDDRCRAAIRGWLLPNGRVGLKGPAARTRSTPSMPTRRQALRHLALVASASSLRVASGANAPKRLGILSEVTEPAGGLFWEPELWRLLAQRGWILGQNIVVERAFANGRSDLLPRLAEELVRKRVDLILCSGEQEATVAAARATRTIPIFAFDASDLVEAGLVESLARPGRNVTGMAFNDGVTAKRLQYLRTVAPSAKRLCWLWGSDTVLSSRLDGTRYDLTALIAARAQNLGFETRFFRVPGPGDLDRAFADVLTWKPHALTTSGRRLFVYGATKDVAQFCLRQRLPSAFNTPEFVQAGGLLSYSISESEAQLVTLRCLAYADRLLRGEKPSDMPVIAPDRYELKINMKTAETLGLTIPQSVLVSADELLR